MPTAVMERGNTKMNRKVLSISSKRQITIPQKFYQSLGFGDEAECVVRGDELVIRPIKTVAGGEFAEQILSDLIKEGLSGEELLTEFKKRQAQIRPAAEAMLAKAEDIAAGKAEYATYDRQLDLCDDDTPDVDNTSAVFPFRSVSMRLPVLCSSVLQMPLNIS